MGAKFFGMGLMTLLYLIIQWLADLPVDVYIMWAAYIGWLLGGQIDADQRIEELEDTNRALHAHLAWMTTQAQIDAQNKINQWKENEPWNR